jgi:hypothetical protein
MLQCLDEGKILSAFKEIIQLLKVTGDVYCSSDPYYDSIVNSLEVFFTE